MKTDDLRLIDLAQKEDELEIFKIIGYNAKMSDLAIINGGQTDTNGYGSYYTMNDSNLYDRMDKIENADYRVKNDPSYYNSIDEDHAYRPMTEEEMDAYDDEIEKISTDYVFSIGPEKVPGKIKRDKTEIYDYQVGIRPVIDTKKSENPIWKTGVKNELGVLEVEYGEYPQQALDANESMKLEEMYQTKLLGTTDKKYSIMTNNDLDNSVEYETRQYQEYITEDGRKFIRVNYVNPEDYELSNASTYEANSQNPIWIEVKPIKWSIDEKTGLAISNSILLAGCPFKNSDKAYDGDFTKTDMYTILEQMSRDIIPSKTQKLAHSNSTYMNADIVKTIIESNKQEEYTEETTRKR